MTQPAPEASPATTLTGATEATPTTPSAEAVPGTEAPAEAAAADKPEAPVGAPEQYEQFNLPEGMEISTDQQEQFVAVAKDLNLSQEQAQKLVDLEATRLASFAEAQQNAYQEQVKEWVLAGKKDPDMGGAKYLENVAVAARAVQQFGGDSLKAALDETGAGNHPAVIKAFWQIGKMISEDALSGAGTQPTPGEPKSHAEILYGSN